MLKYLLGFSMLASLYGMGQLFILAIGYMEQGQGLHPAIAGALGLVLLVAGTKSASLMGDAE